MQPQTSYPAMMYPPLMLFLPITRHFWKQVVLSSEDVGMTQPQYSAQAQLVL